MASVESAALFCPSPDYATARDRFRRAAELAGSAPRAYVNPNRGPQGEELATDTAWFGPPDARRVLVLVSGVHGTEGFCGSAAQLDWLHEGGPAHLPPGLGVLVVHGLNCHGFAWLRRVTEENVDLNRNFIDFGQSLPVNAGYAELHDALVLPALDEATITRAEAVITAFRDKHGPRALQQARGGGQYTHPNGVFFGGQQPTWARRTLETIIAHHRLPEREQVAVVDFHTGLGPFGYGEPINTHALQHPATARMHAWLGDSVTDMDSGSSSSTPVVGATTMGWERACGDRVTLVALEYGTYTMERGRAAMRADHWLHNQPSIDWTAPETRRIKAMIRSQYNPDTPDWWEQVLFRSRQIIRQTTAGLAGS